MIESSNMLIIGIDHGYGNIKTANCVFPTGLLKSDTAPAFTHDLLVWEGKYYTVGVGHKEFTPEKMKDEDFYVLTLAAIASELRLAQRTEATVYLAVGLPLTWVSGQKAAFKEYLLQREGAEFYYRGVNYRVRFAGAEIFPQGFAAVADRLREFGGVNMLCDIGNGTMNVMYITDYKPDMPAESRRREHGISGISPTLPGHNPGDGPYARKGGCPWRSFRPVPQMTSRRSG